jgi:peptidoglycan/xylan/chitin deacetylase (PgdA/CDA1 family)
MVFGKKNRKHNKQITIMYMHEILQQNPEIWDLFTRKEEYNNPLRDQYDRFPHYTSNNRDIFEPKASQYLHEHGYSVEYPNNAPFAVCLTHDIDLVYQSIPSKGLATLRALKQGELTEALHSITRMRSKKLPFCNFSAIMDLEEKYGAKSTFFFMAEKPGEQDYAYNIEDLETDIGEIIDRGWEVGLHGGHTAYLNAHEMREKKVRLEKVTHKRILGYRNHYLRFRVPDTWECLSKAEFQYDATFGYADCAGFRNGMCHPFSPFNLNTNHEIEILEIPLTIMDGTLDQTYMRLDGRSRWEFVKMLINRVAGFHGVFSLLWHNTSMDGGNLELFEKILGYCHERKAWMTSGSNICSLKGSYGYH